MGLRNGTVTLEQNYLKWLRMFNSEKQILKDIFGELALRIEHIGSTSVEGLKAKPIVDIAVAINNFNDIEKIKTRLESTYILKENSHSDEILLIKEDSEITYFLIHVMRIDSKRYKDTIAFRDYIRNNYETMKQYENLKIELAIKYADDRKMYTKSKNDFIQEILKNINS